METWESREEQTDEQGGHQPDSVGAETAPVTVPEPAEQSETESPAEPEQHEASERSPEDTGSELTSERDEDGNEGIIVGTGTEQAPGVGGLGDHPAPAAVRDPATGHIRQHGEPVNTAGNQVSPGDPVDLSSGGSVTDEENLAKLNAAHEPDQVETDRPDIGTPE